MADKKLDVAAVETFDKKKLKHTTVQEKNPLPTAESKLLLKAQLVQCKRSRPPVFVSQRSNKRRPRNERSSFCISISTYLRPVYSSTFLAYTNVYIIVL